MAQVSQSVGAVVVVLVLVLPGRPTPGAGHASDWPTESWAASTPEEQGAIEGLDVPITELLPDYTSANPDPRREQMTLEHLLTMSDGIDWREHDFPYED